ncbi:MAG: hypothetical protein CSA20_00755 [Deltaproteobacteria bacterium]|nr:MAG: hypothetical protein CSA20_00755 [Deltaproteobacteria bacterium]
MDYTQQKLVFKIRKALRYIRLYGIKRTIIKIKGQYHMKKEYDILPKQLSPNEPKKHIAIMGCGNFAYSNIAYYLKKNYGNILRSCMDIDINKAASLFQEYSLTKFTDNPHDIFNDDMVDLIYIASNHASHAEYAIQGLEAGKSVHIEKPHVVNEDQLIRLCEAMEKTGGKVGLGFNRPSSKIGNGIREYLSTQSGATMLNWFIAGHEISPDHWYFKDEEGGRVLGNLCHWTDFTLNLVPRSNRYPLKIIPTRAEKSDCDIAVTYIFGDGSIAAITFSAKGHTFEGVREVFSAHKGNVLVSMKDFSQCVIEVVDKKNNLGSFFRDHGHERNICNSYLLHKGKKSQDYTVDDVWETGFLFLQTREALETNKEVVINRNSRK